MATSTKRLKIGLVLDTSLDPSDGVQQYVIAIGEWLRSQGHDVHYLVGETSRTDLPNIHSLARNVSVRFNGNRTTIPLPTSRRKLRRFLREEQFDVLHVQTPHSPFMAQRLMLAADKRTAIVGTFHIAPYSWLVTVGNYGLGLWLRRSIKRFDKVVSVSEAAARFARSTFHLKTAILPNVVDYNRYHSAQPLRAYDDRRLTVLFLGRLVPRKGCLTLLKAVAQLAAEAELPPFRVLICGKGPMAPRLKQYITDQGLDKVVEMVGFVSEEDKPRYYASADISVFPSSGGESFGIVLLEAMASGKAAVLAGDNPGYRSVMEPRKDLLFNPHSPSDLASKLGYLLKKTGARHEAQKWGATYASDFDTGVVGKELVVIYEAALRKRRNQ